MRKGDFERRAAEMRDKFRNGGQAVATVDPAPTATPKPKREREPPAPNTAKPHHLVAVTQAYFRRRKTTPPSSPRLAVWVEEPTLQRALAFFDLLIKGLEENGMPVTISDGERPATVVTVCEEKLRISLEERSGRLGTLVFRVLDQWGPYEKKWSDGVRLKLEDRVHEIVEFIRAEGNKRGSHTLIQSAEKRAHWRKAQQDEVRRQFIDDLKRDVAGWPEASRIRAYLVAFRSKMERWSGRIDPKSEIAIWLAQAHAYADSLDPLPPDRR
jgi:hypothetical protein